MLKENARDFIDRVNMRGDKVAFYLRPVEEEKPGDFHTTFTVTRGKCKETEEWISRTRLPLYTTTYESQMKREHHLRPDFPVVIVCIFDPKWGRAAWSRNGLFGDILKAL